MTFTGCMLFAKFSQIRQSIPAAVVYMVPFDLVQAFLKFAAIRATTNEGENFALTITMKCMSLLRRALLLLGRLGR